MASFRPSLLLVLFCLACLLAWANLKLFHSTHSRSTQSQPAVATGPLSLKSRRSAEEPATLTAVVEASRGLLFVEAAAPGSTPVPEELEQRLDMMESTLRSQRVAVAGLLAALRRLESDRSNPPITQSVKASTAKLNTELAELGRREDDLLAAERRHAAQTAAPEPITATATTTTITTHHHAVNGGHSATLFLVIGSRRNQSVIDRVHRMMNGRDYLYIVGSGRRVSYSNASSAQPPSSQLLALSSSTGPRVWEVDAPDTYEGLPQKVIKAYKAALQYRPGLKYVVKMDDDMVVKPLMADLSGGLDVDYLGCVVDRPGNPKWHFGKVANGSKWDGRPYYGPWVPYAAGGMGYLLSRKALEVLADAEEVFKEGGWTSMPWDEEIYEDNMVAKLLKAGGIEPNPCCCKWQGFVSSPSHPASDEYTHDECIMTSAASMAKFLDNSRYRPRQAYHRLDECTVPYSSHAMSKKKNEEAPAR